MISEIDTDGKTIDQRTVMRRRWRWTMTTAATSGNAEKGRHDVRVQHKQVIRRSQVSSGKAGNQSNLCVCVCGKGRTR